MFVLKNKENQSWHLARAEIYCGSDGIEYFGMIYYCVYMVYINI